MQYLIKLYLFIFNLSIKVTKNYYARKRLFRQKKKCKRNSI